ncbi:hypothetical protein ACLOJK_011579 [Asimina triloba]
MSSEILHFLWQWPKLTQIIHVCQLNAPAGTYQKWQQRKKRGKMIVAVMTCPPS